MSTSQTVRKRIREALLKAHGWKYTRIAGSGAGLCFYCASPATGLDHVPPLSYADVLTDMRRTSAVPFYLVAACHECNTRLGARPLFTLCERARHLEQRLSNEYERRFALWSDDEAAEMGYHFQVMIKARREALSSMVERIRALQLCAINGDTWAADEADL